MFLDGLTESIVDGLSHLQRMQIFLLLLLLLLLVHLNKLSYLGDGSIQRAIGLLLSRFAVRLAMSVKVGSDSKRFATNGANMRLLTRVDRLVYFQIAQDLERFVAHGTGVLARSSVHVQSVAAAGRAGRETFSALLAQIRPLSSVDSRMRRQTGTRRKRHGTHGAAKLFDSAVRVQVEL